MNRLREISFCHICLIVSVALAVASAHSSGVFAEEPETRILRDTIRGAEIKVTYGRKMRPKTGKVSTGQVKTMEREPFQKKTIIVDGSTARPISVQSTEPEPPVSHIGPMIPMRDQGSSDSGGPRVLNVRSRTTGLTKAESPNRHGSHGKVSTEVRTLHAKDRPMKVLSIKDGPVREVEISRRPIALRGPMTGQGGVSPDIEGIDLGHANHPEGKHEDIESKILAGPVLQHFAGKYQYEPRIEDLRVNMTQTLYGPSGTLIIKNIPVRISPETHDALQRARSIAMSFIEAEAALFAVSDMGEIREKWIDIPKKGADAGPIYVAYGRYINGVEMRYVNIQVTVKPDNTIDLVSHIVPATPEMYKATSSVMLSEDEARNIIREALRESSLSPDDLTNATTSSNLSRYVISSEPYAIWEWAGGVKGFTLNAFTGGIIGVLESAVKSEMWK